MHDPTAHTLSPDADPPEPSWPACDGSGSFRDRPLTERPRERLAFLGPDQLRDDELVALVLGSGAAQPTARTLLDRVGGLGGLRRIGVNDLCQVPGVGLARASQLKAALELGRRALLPEPLNGLLVRCAADLAHPLQVELAQGEQEAVHAFGLDARHRVRCRHIAAIGQVDRVHVNAADVYRPMLREGVASVIVAHNHPSGDARPSPEDQRLTMRLSQAGIIIGIPLLDHVIVAQSGYYSFAEHALIDSILNLPPAD